MTEIDGALYRIAPNGEWQYDCVFYDLEPNTEYTVEVCIAPTVVSFASGIAELHARTLSGTTVHISRDAAGNLIADLGTISATVKKNGGGNPVQPGRPDETGTTQKNDGNGDMHSAQTGDDSNSILWVVCLFASLDGFVLTSVYRKKEKSRNISKKN